MALTRSLSTGASSLRANQQRFDVISNNLANLNTIGYKSNRANFEEEFSQILKYGNSPSGEGSGTGGVDPMQIGLGVRVGSIQQDMSQGNLETTNRPLDMALQGDGFFVYNLNGTEMYSRAGSINRDQNGFLVDSTTGAYLQGFNVQTDSNGRILKEASGKNILEGTKNSIQIPESIISTPRQTQNVRLTGNLNSSNEDGFQKRTSITIYDSVGSAHELRFNFTKDTGASTYTLTADIDGNALATNETVTFNPDGTLQSPLNLVLNASDINTVLGNQAFDETTPTNININLADSNNLTAGITNFSAPNTATFIEQDGYKTGSLLGLSVDDNGQLWGAFSNGQSELLGQVVVAKFNNMEGLMRNGSNMYTLSPNSGLPNIGTAGDIFPGTRISGNSLEMSNVDMTSQFVDMISTQRAFEAASRTITLSDQLLSETTNLKR